MAGAAIKIPAELFALAESSRFEGRFGLSTLQAGPDEYRFTEPVSWAVEVTNTGAALLVSGTARATGSCECSRCLEEATFRFEGDIEGYFLVEGDNRPDEGDDEGEAPGEDEFDALPADHVIDLEPLIKAALLVDAPQQPLCREDCAGLCPSCGANLNEGDCGCARDGALVEFDRAANPFAALVDFKFE